MMNSEYLGVPLLAVLGGLLIGLAAVGLHFALGRIAGISGILFSALNGTAGRWRWFFLGGLLLGAGVTAYLFPALNVVTRPDPGHALLIAAGLLVGWGTRLGGGCTSGHGVCGLGRLAPRSFVAVAAFMTAGVFAASILRHALGGV